MSHRRAALAVLSAAAVLGAALGPSAAPAAADERQAAKNRVTVAKRTVASLQAKAEHAIEVHNGLLVAARKQVALRQAAADRADAARAALVEAQSAADAAEQEALTASAQADDSEAALHSAQDAARASQDKLDRIASGAFRGQGRMGALAQLLSARDPLELANGKKLINTFAEDQHRTVVELHTAQAQAEKASTDAEAAERAKSAAAERAAGLVERRDAAQQAAADANQDAAVSAQAAHRALASAQHAKARAAALVARAEAVLHRAVRTVASLEAAARAARRQAATVSHGNATGAARKAIDAAFDQIGVPYSWGGGNADGPSYGFAQGAGTKGFDCSGLTLYAYAQAGISLDHYTGSQWQQSPHVARGDWAPGDLLFFAYDQSDSSTIHHVGMYIGNGRMIEAPYTGEVVRVASAYRDDYIGATRPSA